MASIPEGVLLGMGNPLLDIQTNVDKDFLEKWGLKENDAIIGTEKHVEMFDELEKNFPVEYIPGGSTQNTLRVCQWMLGLPNRTVFFGAVGNDKHGKLLEEHARKGGVNAVYQVTEGEKTGTCAALINGEHRSLCVCLAAANTFQEDHIRKQENWKLVQNAQYYYSAAFFLTVCTDAYITVAKEFTVHNKPVLLNLAAPFIPERFYEQLTKAIFYADYVFGNEAEAAAFTKSANIDGKDLHSVVRYIANLEKANNSIPRTVVITQGAEAVLVAITGSKEVKELPVDSIAKRKIVDTNAAGDAFVGGFLSQLVRGASIEACVKTANYAAGIVIQHQGCTFPPSCDYVP